MAVGVPALLAGLTAAAFATTVHVTPALAEPATSKAPVVQVLGLDSEDADEHADAVTGALRARIAEQPGVALGNTTQSVGSLTMQLRCKPRPDAECATKIFTQLQTERFIWGVAIRNGASVTIELHLVQKGKPDLVRKNAIAESQKSARDEALARVVSNMLSEMLPTYGSARVTGGQYQCPVLLDGERKGVLDGKGGTLFVEATPGPHTFDLGKPCASAPQKKTIDLNKPIDVDFVSPAAGGAGAGVLAGQGSGQGAGAANGEGGGVPVRPIVGWSLVGLGVASGVVGTVFAIQYMSARSKGIDLKDAAAREIPLGQTLNCGAVPANAPNATELCKQKDKMDSALVPEIIFYGAAVALVASGAVVLLTGSKSEDKAAAKSGAAPKPKGADLSVSPWVSPGGAGRDRVTGALVSGSF